MLHPIFWEKLKNTQICSLLNFFIHMLKVKYGKVIVDKLGDNCIKFGIWGGKSAVLRSEISFYGDASAEP